MARAHDRRSLAGAALALLLLPAPAAAVHQAPAAPAPQSASLLEAGQQALALSAAGNHKGAEPYYRRMLALIEAAAPGSAEAAQANAFLAVNLQSQSRYAESEAPARRAADIASRPPLAGTEQQASYVSLVGEALSGQQKGGEAEKALRQVVDLRRRLNGDKAAETALASHRLGFELDKQGRHRESEPLHRAAYAALVAAHGEAHPYAQMGASYLASTLEIQGRAAEAEPLRRAGVAANAKSWGADNIFTGMAHLQLALNLERQGRAAEAEGAAREALKIFPASPESSQTYHAAQVVIRSLEKQGRAKEAEPLARQLLAGMRGARGERHPLVAETIALVGSNLEWQGRYADSEAEFRRALELREAVLGRSDPLVAESTAQVARAMEKQGRFLEAEQLYRRAIEIRTAARPIDPTATAMAYAGLARNLLFQGRYPEAETLLRRALEIAEQPGLKLQITTATLTNNLSVSVGAQKRYAEAEQLDRKALAMLIEDVGETNQAVAIAYSNVAGDLFLQKKFAEADPLFRKSAQIARAAMGPAHPETANILSAWAANYDALDKAREAEPLHREAIRLLSASFGEAHPALITAQANFAESLAERPGAAGEAVSLARTAAAMARARRQAAASDPRGSGEGGYRREPTAIAFDAFILSALARASAAPGETPALRAEAFSAAQEASVSVAARAFAQSAARSLSGSPDLAALVRRQQDIAVELKDLDDLLLQNWKADAAVRARLGETVAARTAELRSIDRELGERFPAYAELLMPRALTVEEVQGRLEEDEGLLFILPVGDDMVSFAVSKRGAAWSRAEDGIALAATRVKKLSCNIDSAGCVSAAEAEQPFPIADAHALYRDLVAPVEQALAGTKRLYAVTAGALSAVPLTLLVTDPPKEATGDELAQVAAARWLADRYAFTSLPSVSSLRVLRRPPRTGDGPAFAGFGAPTLAPAAAADRSLAKLRLFRSVSGGGRPMADPAALRRIPSLPGTEVELKALAATLGAPPAAIRTGAAATERAVRGDPALRKARVVAFATHGVLPYEISGLDQPGLIFTPPQTGSAEDDGVLTASEALQLSLSADWVILSACNTATADGSSSAEGLSSLARAFIYAGAASLLASHWRIGDEVTAALTSETLALRNKGMTRALAHQQAMRTIRTGLRSDGSRIAGWTPDWAHPAAWAPFSIISTEDR